MLFFTRRHLICIKVLGIVVTAMIDGDLGHSGIMVMNNLLV